MWSPQSFVRHLFSCTKSSVSCRPSQAALEGRATPCQPVSNSPGRETNGNGKQSRVSKAGSRIVEMKATCYSYPKPCRNTGNFLKFSYTYTRTQQQQPSLSTRLSPAGGAVRCMPGPSGADRKSPGRLERHMGTRRPLLSGCSSWTRPTCGAVAALCFAAQLVAAVDEIC